MVQKEEINSALCFFFFILGNVCDSQSRAKVGEKGTIFVD